ncbi:MAG: glycosyltransferase [Sulfolobales archaeon]|nr:glycosyltransferase [Sulfolobales archaeon]
MASVAKFSSDKYSEWFGIDLSRYNVFSLFNFRLAMFGIYLRLLMPILVEKAVERYSPELVFVDIATYRPAGKRIKERVKLIEYIHFPIEVSIEPRFRGSGLYYGEDPYILERYSSPIMRVYWWLYTKLLPRYVRENPFEVASAVLANSRWTAEVVKKLYGKTPLVLNPPIAPSTQIVYEPVDFNLRSSAVVLLGRFSEEKRYHWVVERVIPKLIREVKGVEVYIVGSARTRASASYLNKIESLSRKLGLKVSRDLRPGVSIHLVSDAPREAINGIMDASKVFLHATINEHWGVAAAEAMARGLPVVVHKSGGTWSDLVSKGLFGLGYGCEDEAVDAIAKLLSDEKLWRRYSKKSLERVRDLAFEKFVEKFLTIEKTI